MKLKILFSLLIFFIIFSIKQDFVQAQFCCSDPITNESKCWTHGFCCNGTWYPTQDCGVLPPITCRGNVSVSINSGACGKSNFTVFAENIGTNDLVVNITDELWLDVNNNGKRDEPDTLANYSTWRLVSLMAGQTWENNWTAINTSDAKRYIHTVYFCSVPFNGSNSCYNGSYPPETECWVAATQYSNIIRQDDFNFRCSIPGSVACNNDLECDDGIYCTLDLCVNPGTTSSFCFNPTDTSNPDCVSLTTTTIPKTPTYSFDMSVEGPSFFSVGEKNLVRIYIQNTGNMPDKYYISYELQPPTNFIDVEITLTTVNIGAGGSTTTFPKVTVLESHVSGDVIFTVTSETTGDSMSGTIKILESDLPFSLPEFDFIGIFVLIFIGSFIYLFYRKSKIFV